MVDRGDCRAIWAALESGRAITLHDLQMIGEIEPQSSVEYFNVLIREGYTRMTGIRRAASGEPLPIFKLVRRTGPEAPYEEANGLFIDPNLIKKTSKAPRGLFKAMVRLAAEGMTGPLTSRQVRDALKTWPESRTKKFDSIWAQLKMSGEIYRHFDSGSWEYRPNPQADAFRDYFKAHVGESISAEDLKHGIGNNNGALVRQALDLLIAEGFTVKVTPARQRNRVMYRVEGPAGTPVPTEEGRLESLPHNAIEQAVKP